MDFSLNLPEVFNAAEYFVDRNVADGRGDKVAVVCQERSLTYAQIQTGVNRFGNALRSLGLRMEDRVALLMLDTEKYPQAFFSAIKIGAVPICLNTLMRPKDYTYFLNDSRARVLVIDAALLPVIAEIRTLFTFLKHIIVANGQGQEDDLSFETLIADQPDTLTAAPTTPDDPCFWLYSSGSTGQPKGTVHLQHDMVYACETYGKQVLQIREDDVCFSAAKLFFAYGLGNGLYFPFSVGATAAYMPDRPTPQSVYKTVARHKPTLFFGVPTLYGAMLAEKSEMPGVRLCVSAGEALPAEILKRWKERFDLDILDGIGSTEITHIFISNRQGEIRPGSSGRLVPGYDAKIVDADFNPVPEGDIGTLLIRGDSIAACYWNKHEKTKCTMMGAWINTDDKFFKDTDGFFHYVGRSNDMLKVGGIWVSPIEVEACLIQHPAVLECAVIGSPDNENLIKPRAFVVLNKDITPSAELEKELKNHVKATLAHYKYPRWIDFVDDLPKTATGKIKRFELKEQTENGAASVAA
jgi:4-hydroxybenzoate-CoA ligase